MNERRVGQRHARTQGRSAWPAAKLFALLCAASTACTNTAPPLGQLVVFIDTDAPIPDPSQGSADGLLGTRQAPLFDRLRVELFSPGETTPCQGCSAEFPVDAAKMRARAFSFGVLPRPGAAGSRIRLQLYRSATLGEPRPESAITWIARVPPVVDEGDDAVLVRTARLRMQDVGATRGSLEQPLELENGPPTHSEVGTWRSEASRDCAGSAPTGAVCIPGGAFVMGDPRVTTSAGIQGRRERVVVLSPFYLHDREVTVAMLRRSGLAELDARGRLIDPSDDLSTFSGCTYSIAESSREELPVNCISHGLARRYCRSLGGDLPTEAQFEYAASLQGRYLFPWGDAEPECGQATVRLGIPRSVGGCGEDTSTPMPTRAGTAPLDVVLGPTRTTDVIWDLGANLAEWARDNYQTDDAPCWAAPIVEDPVCASGTDNETASRKGSSIRGYRVYSAQVRRETSPTNQTDDVGFRCAFPGGAGSPLL